MKIRVKREAVAGAVASTPGHISLPLREQTASRTERGSMKMTSLTPIGSPLAIFPSIVRYPEFRDGATNRGVGKT